MIIINIIIITFMITTAIIIIIIIITIIIISSSSSSSIVIFLKGGVRLLVERNSNKSQLIGSNVLPLLPGIGLHVRSAAWKPQSPHCRAA